MPLTAKPRDSANLNYGLLQINPSPPQRSPPSFCPIADAALRDGHGTRWQSTSGQCCLSQCFRGVGPFGLIGAAAILWPNDAATIKAIADLDKPQFAWSPTPKDGDSILIADVAGNRKFMPEILKQVMDRWYDGPWRCHPQANIFQKRIFTYRRGELVG
jgi:hypothetical protein